MIDWVHERGFDWGSYLRCHQDGWPKVSLMGRIMDEGAVGAAIKQQSQKIPIRFMQREVAEFHKAWDQLSEKRRLIVWVRYVPKITWEQRIEALGMKSKTTYYKWLHECHEELARLMPRHAHVDIGN